MTVVVLARATDVVPEPLTGWDFRPVTMPRIDVSSTALRARIARGVPIDFLVPAGAIRVLRERRLYTPGE